MRRIDLGSKTKVELLKLAQRLGLRGVSTLQKAALIGRIQRARERAATAIKRRAIRKPNGSTNRNGLASQPVDTMIPSKQRKTNPAAKPTPPARKRSARQAANEPVLAELSAHKFDVTPQTKQLKQAFREENLGEMPVGYGTGRLFLTARDPHGLFAYWDLASQQVAGYQGQSGTGQLLLRVFEKGQPAPINELTLSGDTRNCYIPVDKADSTYIAELVVRQPDGAFQVVSRSRETTTPADRIAADSAVRFVTIPAELALAELLKLVDGQESGEPALATALQQLEVAGVSFPFKVEVEPSPWTPEQEAQLERLICGDLLQRCQLGAAENSEGIQRRMRGEGVASLFSAFSPAGASWSGGAAQPPFWLAVNAELIIYGATDPGATVTIDGKPVELRSDGTFSFHHTFPDGQYRLPIVAVAGRGDAQRAVELQFARQTVTQGDVGPVTQPPQLQPPESAN